MSIINKTQADNIMAPFMENVSFTEENNDPLYSNDIRGVTDPHMRLF